MSIAKMFDGTNWVVLNGGGGSAPTNMVTTDTEQTISGNKTFTNNVIIFDSYLNLNSSDIIFNNNTDHCIWLSSDVTYGTELAFMVDDTTPVYLGNGSIRSGYGSLRVLSDLAFDNDKYINLRGDYCGIYFRYKDAATNVQPNGIIGYDNSTGQLSIGASMGVIETYTKNPYIYGRRYRGYFASASNASAKYVVRLEFIDDGTISSPANTLNTFALLRSYLYRGGYTSLAKACPATGNYNGYRVTGVYATSSTIYVAYVSASSGAYVESTTSFTTLTTVNFTKVN